MLHSPDRSGVRCAVRLVRMRRVQCVLWATCYAGQRRGRGGEGLRGPARG